jgi:HPt (histidine-containing phosphotransfer) domain-containing protein
MPTAAVVLAPEFLDRLVRFGGDKLLNSVIDIFLKEGPVRLDVARHGAASGNATVVRHALHSLKSSAAQLGAVQLSEYCGEGELLAMENASAALIAVAVTNVERAHAEARCQLMALQARRHGTSGKLSAESAA